MGEIGIKLEKNVLCTLSDGTILRSDVYRPDDGERYPVLMLRLPYNKEKPRYYNEYLEVPRMVQAGYIVILQDVRGRFASEGNFYPFIHEGGRMGGKTSLFERQSWTFWDVLSRLYSVSCSSGKATFLKGDCTGYDGGKPDGEFSRKRGGSLRIS